MHVRLLAVLAEHPSVSELFSHIDIWTLHWPRLAVKRGVDGVLAQFKDRANDDQIAKEAEAVVHLRHPFLRSRVWLRRLVKAHAVQFANGIGNGVNRVADYRQATFSEARRAAHDTADTLAEEFDVQLRGLCAAGAAVPEIRRLEAPDHLARAKSEDRAHRHGVVFVRLLGIHGASGEFRSLPLSSHQFMVGRRVVVCSPAACCRSQIFPKW